MNITALIIPRLTNRERNNQMAANQLYRVLWVDEEEDRWGLKEQARRLDIIVYQYHSWEEAKMILERRFDAFSAIVLDGKSVIKQSDQPTEDFLYQVVKELETLFAQHEEQLPWYVLSSQKGEAFSQTLHRISMGDRQEMIGLWGTVGFEKDAQIQELCVQLRKVVGQRKENKIGRMYRPVFSVIREYLNAEASNVILDILMALHFPETKRNFDAVLYYTQLRRILEYLFRAANQLKILPDEVMGDSEKINLSNSSLYLSGREVVLGHGKIVRYGKPGDAFFPPIVAQLVKSILVVANKNSHTSELGTIEMNTLRNYYDTIRSDNMLFGYTLQLCDVIVFFGKQAEKYKLTSKK